MAKEAPSISTEVQHAKLPRVSQNQKIQKRPLLHPPIAAPRRSASTPKIIYISTSSPFISVVKRVRKYLHHIEERAAGPIDLKHGHRKTFKQIEDGIKSARKKEPEEVLLKATGKAIEKCLALAAWWQDQDGIKVVLRTGSVGAVDDVVAKDEALDEDGVEESSRVRRVSCLEVGISLK